MPPQPMWLTQGWNLSYTRPPCMSYHPTLTSSSVGLHHYLTNGQHCFLSYRNVTCDVKQYSTTTTRPVATEIGIKAISRPSCICLNCLVFRAKLSRETFIYNIYFLSLSPSPWFASAKLPTVWKQIDLDLHVVIKLFFFFAYHIFDPIKIILDIQWQWQQAWQVHSQLATSLQPTPAQPPRARPRPSLTGTALRLRLSRLRPRAVAVGNILV